MIHYEVEISVDLGPRIIILIAVWHCDGVLSQASDMDKITAIFSFFFNHIIEVLIYLNNVPLIG